MIWLKNKRFAGFENDEYISTRFGFGAEKGNSVIKTLMKFYESIHFFKLDSTRDLLPCPVNNS